ncbi:hypothetical protein QBC32DRAFT_211636, partial [Pseudoneurospora amorphoporcata]
PTKVQHPHHFTPVSKNVHHPKRPIRLLALHYRTLLALHTREKKVKENQNSETGKKSHVPGVAMQRAGSHLGHVGYVSGLCEVSCC